jgi:hypothetical protein
MGQPNAGPTAEKYSDQGMMSQVFKQYAQAASGDLQFAIWYNLQDRPSDERLYGLLTPDGQPKPAFSTYQALAKALADARFERFLPQAETGSDKLEAYRFALQGKPDRALFIAWRKDAGAAIALPVPATQATITDTAGRDTSVADGDASDLNPAAGALSIAVGPDPIIIRY